MPLKFSYDDKTEDPPAPFVTVRVRHLVYQERVQELRAKLDTGADVSSIPEATAATLGLREAARLFATGFDGRITQVALYAAQIDLPNGQSVQLNVAGIPSDYALLGRDILNQLRLLLDGPAHTLEILE